VRAGIEGKSYGTATYDRTVIDWILILGTTALFAVLGFMARLPHMELSFAWAITLALAMLGLLVAGGLALWRTTRFR